MADGTTHDTPGTGATGERADLLEALGKHRELFLVPVRGLSDAQARDRPTASELCLGGLVKHVTRIEGEWRDFVQRGPGEPVDWDSVDWSDPPPEVVAHAESFTMRDDETLADLVAGFEESARATDALVASVDLDARQPLPQEPWFEPGATWSARRVFVHLVAEIAQHAGHADILRETIDGQRTMG